MTSIVLITGASGGIRRALAGRLHAGGDRVVAVDRDAGRLADVEAAVRVAADTATLLGGSPDRPGDRGGRRFRHCAAPW